MKVVLIFDRKLFTVENLSTLAASKMLFIKIQHIYITMLPISFYILTNGLRHHVSCVQKWLIWFYAVLLWFYYLMMIPCGSKYARMISVVL
jgi:hypothetical protein